MSFTYGAERLGVAQTKRGPDSVRAALKFTRMLVVMSAHQGAMLRAAWHRPHSFVYGTGIFWLVAKARSGTLKSCDVMSFARCGGKLRVIASIEEPEVIAKILGHLERTARDPFQPEWPLGARAPPPPARLL